MRISFELDTDDRIGISNLLAIASALYGPVDDAPKVTAKLCECAPARQSDPLADHVHEGVVGYAGGAGVSLDAQDAEPPKERAKRGPKKKDPEALAAADIREAEKAAMIEAISQLAPPPAALVLPGSLPPPSTVNTVAVPPPSLPTLVPSPPPLPSAQTPALPGQALTLPHIPPDGQPMPLADLLTVIRMSASAGPGVAFTVMQKHRIFDPKTAPEGIRAQFAREVAIAAKLIKE